MIIPVRDRAAHLGAAVESALDQRGVRLEVVVVDDGSTDETAQLFVTPPDPRVRLVRQPPLGVTAARNHGTRVARGAWLLLLDSDDALLPGGAAALLSATAADVDVVSGAVERIEADRTVLTRPSAHGPEFSNVAGQFLAGAMLIRATAWRDVGGQLEALTFGENTELAMRLAARAQRIGQHFVAIDTAVARYVLPPAPRYEHAGRAVAGIEILRTDRHLLGRSSRP